MRPVQCDGFILYVGREAEVSETAQAPLERPAAAPGRPVVEARPTLWMAANTAIEASPPRWSVGLQVMIAAMILLGLFGAYSLGRYAGKNWSRGGASPASAADPRSTSKVAAPNAPR